MTKEEAAGIILRAFVSLSAPQGYYGDTLDHYGRTGMVWKGQQQLNDRIRAELEGLIARRRDLSKGLANALDPRNPRSCDYAELDEALRCYCGHGLRRWIPEYRRDGNFRVVELAGRAQEGGGEGPPFLVILIAAVLIVLFLNTIGSGERREPQPQPPAAGIPSQLSPP